MKTTSHYRGPKRVRIQTGHEARFIEKRNPYQSCAKKFKGTHKILQKDRAGKIAWDKTHRPSISELVYRYLEKESNREVIDMQKNNATKQFRKFHRRKYLKKLASNVRKSPHKTMKNESFNSIPWKPEMFSQWKKWPKKG
ncbi:PREDICTED: uncharacterized protein LOC105368415 [Ceratosolen solmsi marchali]|uniref:Uncharacterized protein LOC105368415 n=1 Tax=Ceratosolen solmsi marchali TaxID=326594 RepID=A0AAJ6YWQ7_9HYME|nr:PREDICTED: uncharacterized protein LOC105368415 [Ceratosolen solmsi marchali]